MAYKFPASPALTQPATAPIALFSFLSTAKAAGWTVASSSDGTSLTAITSGGMGAGGLGNSHAWFVMVSPDGKRAWCLQRGTSDTAWYVKYSPGSNFGAGTATQTPTASDQVYVLGAGPDSAPSFANWFAANGSYNYSCVFSTTAPYFWASFAYPLAGGTPTHGGFYDGMVFGGPSNDPDAYLAYANTGAAFEVDVFSRGYARGTWEGASASIDGVQWPFYPGNGFNPDPVTGDDEGFPCLFYDNQVGNKGGLATVLWEATGNASNARPTGTTFTLSSSRDHILVGFCILPWDGSTVGSNYGLQLPFSQATPTPPSPTPAPTPSSPTTVTAGGSHAATQGQMVQLLLGLFPPSWIPAAAIDPVAPSGDLYTLFGAMADNLGRTADLLLGSPSAVKAQLRLKSMGGPLLDVAAADFYGTDLHRGQGETDTNFLNRVVSGLFVSRITRPAVFAFLEALTGVAPRITEVQNPGDCGGYTKTSGAPFSSAGKQYYNLKTGLPSCAYGVDNHAAPFRWTHAQGGYQAVVPAAGPVPAVGVLPSGSHAYEAYIETALPLGAGAQLNAAYGYGSAVASRYGTPSVVGGKNVYSVGSGWIPGFGNGYGPGAASGWGAPSKSGSTWFYASAAGISSCAYFGGWGAPDPASGLYDLIPARLALLSQLAPFIAWGINARVGFRAALVIGAGGWTG